MSKQFLKQAIGWGFLLWLIGYVLGIVLFMFVPASVLGWCIMPIGTALTLWVLFKKISGTTLKYYAQIAIAWTLLAVVCDYVFLVVLFKPAGGYYKLDVFVYYAVTFVLPIIVGYIKQNKRPAMPPL